MFEKTVGLDRFALKYLAAAIVFPHVRDRVSHASWKDMQHDDAIKVALDFADDLYRELSKTESR